MTQIEIKNTWQQLWVQGVRGQESSNQTSDRVWKSARKLKSWLSWWVCSLWPIFQTSQNCYFNNQRQWNSLQCFQKSSNFIFQLGLFPICSGEKGKCRTVQVACQVCLPTRNLLVIIIIWTSFEDWWFQRLELPLVFNYEMCYAWCIEF